MADISTTANVSLSESYIGCVQAFGRFLLALNEDDCYVVRAEQVHLQEVEDEYGRIKVWGNQTNADLPPRARGSLDDVLRHDDELKELVQSILIRLTMLLMQATSIAKRKHDEPGGSDCDSISSASEDSDSSSGSHDGGGHQRQRVPKVCRLVQQILAQTRSLYDLSSLLRRPKVTDRYISSVNSKLKRDLLSESENLPLGDGFSKADERHIVEKVLQLRGLTKSTRLLEFENEDAAPAAQDSVAWNLIEDIPWFCRRLAQANTRRREQLWYWADHPYKVNQDQSIAARLQTPNLPQKKSNHQSPSQVSTLRPADSKRTETVTSKQSFSTVAISDIHDTKTNIRPKTVYAATAMGQGRSNSVPDPPTACKENPTFACPYCGMMLQSGEMMHRQAWKRHVFRDLRPYICTFESCTNEQKLYVSRHAWIHHELQVHRREYACHLCDKVVSSRRTASAHLKEHHSDSFSPAQLGIILELCNRQVDVTAHKDSCLVCGEELPLPALQEHLAEHMEDFALFVLPSNGEEDAEGSDVTARAANNRSTGNTIRSGVRSEGNKHRLTTTGSVGQAPADFAKLLSSQEVGFVSKISAWKTTDGDTGSAWSDSIALELRVENFRDNLPNRDTLPSGEGEESQREPSDAAKLDGEVNSNDDDLLLSEEEDRTAETRRREAKMIARQNWNDVLALVYMVVKLSSYKAKDKNDGPPSPIVTEHTPNQSSQEATRKIDRFTDLAETLLSHAAEKGDQESVEYLLSISGHDIEAKDGIYNRTPLSWAAGNGHSAVVKLLLDTNKVDVNATDVYGRTALTWAVERKHKDIVQMLLSTGEAAVNVVDKYGHTPLSFATAHGDESIVELLVENGARTHEGGFPEGTLQWAALQVENSMEDINRRVAQLDEGLDLYRIQGTTIGIS